MATLSFGLQKKSRDPRLHALDLGTPSSKNFLPAPLRAAVPIFPGVQKAAINLNLNSIRTGAAFFFLLSDPPPPTDLRFAGCGDSENVNPPLIVNKPLLISYLAPTCPLFIIEVQARSAPQRAKRLMRRRRTEAESGARGYRLFKNAKKNLDSGSKWLVLGSISKLKGCHTRRAMG